jgi:hypothetical protein
MHDYPPFARSPISQTIAFAKTNKSAEKAYQNAPAGFVFIVAEKTIV